MVIIIIISSSSRTWWVISERVASRIRPRRSASRGRSRCREASAALTTDCHYCTHTLLSLNHDTLHIVYHNNWLERSKLTPRGLGCINSMFSFISSVIHIIISIIICIIISSNSIIIIIIIIRVSVIITMSCILIVISVFIVVTTISISVIIVISIVTISITINRIISLLYVSSMLMLRGLGSALLTTHACIPLHTLGGTTCLTLLV